MTPRGTIVKHYYGMNMPHLVFSVRRAEVCGIGKERAYA